MDVLGAFEADAMDDGVNKPIATGIGEEHRDSVGYLSFICEESEVGD